MTSEASHAGMPVGVSDAGRRQSVTGAVELRLAVFLIARPPTAVPGV
jgi:hypothetical protein